MKKGCGGEGSQAGRQRFSPYGTWAYEE